MTLTREKAMQILTEGVSHNPGPWETHCKLVAQCAEKIAAACGMDPEKAYILGLLHDMGRRFGVSALRHVYDGWQYLLQLGYPEPAKICLTHSFCVQSNGIADYIGKHDTTKQQAEVLAEALAQAVYDDYDLLIQLCDSLAGGERVMPIEDRMQDVKDRHGSYPQDKWDKNIALMDYFSQKAGKTVYDIIGL